MAVDGVQQCLTGLLTFDPGDLKQLVQPILGSWDLLDDVQLLRVQDVQHVVKDGLQVTRVQTNLSEHGVFLLWRGNRQGAVIGIEAILINIFRIVTDEMTTGKGVPLCQ